MGTGDYLMRGATLPLPNTTLPLPYEFWLSLWNNVHNS